MRTAILFVLILGCSRAAETLPPEPTPSEQTPPPEYPLDDVLRLHHLQAKSTHNSYHIETAGNSISQLDYSHAPLTVQLAEQGVRHFELDLRKSADDTHFEVYHLPVIDDQTQCRVFTECLQQIKSWSDANPGHHPIVVQLELKDTFPGAGDPAESYFAEVHAEIGAVWPPERVITPDEIQGAAPSLGEAVAQNGWPTLGELRGKVLFMLDDEGEYRNAYTRGLTSAQGRIVFPDSSPGDPFAAVAVINDPVADAAAIAAAVAANILVRTRADADVVEPQSGDTTRRDAALTSGAHFISTDFPAPVEGYDYIVEIPRGTPSRCNPVAAPAECAPDLVESPDRLK